MKSDDQLIQCKIDLKSGAVDVSAPPEHFNSAVEKAKELAVALAHHSAAARGQRQYSAEPGEIEVAGVPPSPMQNATTRRRAGGSAGRTGRIGSFEPADLKLTEDQERHLVKHYAEKRPLEQHEQVAVAMVKGEQLLKRQAFSYNEIYTLLRLSGEKELPKALDVVLNRMINDNWTTREGKGFALKFPARDFVDQHLPRSAK